MKCSALNVDFNGVKFDPVGAKTFLCSVISHMILLLWKIAYVQRMRTLKVVFT